MLDKPASHTSVRATGPLAGYRIIEFAGIGPGPFACMMLADMGAEVVTLDRVGAKKNMKGVAVRGRKVVELDLKDKAAIGPAERPVPPLNLVGDFGGGALYLVVGVLAALLEASRSGKGQVVDAAMCDGAASLMSMFFDFAAAGRWVEGRENNFLDGGAHYYGVYQCACGNFVSIGSIEPQFYALLRQLAGLSDLAFDSQMERAAWPSLKQRLAAIFKTKTREEWCRIMEGTDICFAPVLSLAEAPRHPHMAARKTFVQRHGVSQPAPAPRFSRTPSAIREPVKAEIAEVIREWRREKPSRP